MTKLSCDLCDFVGEGESFEGWMENMKPHYAQAHADFMQAQGEKTPEEQQAGMEAWMAENKARFEAASS